MDGEKVAADLVGDLLVRGSGNLAPLGVRVGRPRWVLWLALHLASFRGA
jgi:hypothetical protein